MGLAGTKSLEAGSNGNLQMSCVNGLPGRPDQRHGELGPGSGDKIQYLIHGLEQVGATYTPVRSSAGKRPSRS